MTKIISISDEAYEKLKRRKGNASFTKAILSLLESRKRHLSDFAGIWKDSPEMDEIYKGILKDRHKRDERPAAKW
jgi:predicted CopG family antitoxin